MHVEAVLRDIDADEGRRSSGRLIHDPSLRMRAHGLAAAAAQATVRVPGWDDGRGPTLSHGLARPRGARAPVRRQPRRLSAGRQLRDTRGERGTSDSIRDIFNDVGDTLGDAADDVNREVNDVIDDVGGTDSGTPSTTAREAQVTRLYDTVFDRPPDDAGLDFWTTALRTGAVGLDDVAALFVRSPDFQDRYG